MVIVDGSGEELARGTASRRTIPATLETAIENYNPPIEWAASYEEGVRQADSENKLLLVFFTDGRIASEKMLEALADSAMREARQKLVMVKVELKKDEETDLSRELKIKRSPAIVVINLKAKSDKKRVAVRVTSAKKGEQLGAIVTKAIVRFEKANSGERSGFGRKR